MKKENFRKLFAATGTITSVADVESTLTKIVNWMFGIFWIIAAGVIIWAAFTFLTAGGSDEKIEKAKKILLYTLIAAAVVLLASGVKPIVTNILQGK